MGRQVYYIITNFKAPQLRGFFYFNTIMNTINIQAVKGYFHYEAILKYFKNAIIIDSQMTFSGIIDYINDYGVIAVENTIARTILSNFNFT
jgi:hypothetical protein|tara:strand:- start:7638 stop:7910 length:273 start_codon:yes stop_codon:yes gene_type:complete